jgi:uncharacterized OB-fold protein
MAKPNPTPAPGKPLPTITDLTRPFWTAAKEGRLVLQKCQRCGVFNFHPTAVRNFERAGVSRSVAMNFQGWQAELPVLMCLIDLDDGARMYGQLTHCAPEALRIGMRVQA